MKTLHLAIIVTIGIVAIVSSFNSTLAQNVTNSSNPIPPIPYSILRSAVPTLTPSENQTVVNVALSVPGLQSWSHDWRYVSTGFLGNNKLATVGFEWEYAMVDLKAPSSSAPVPCDQGWQAEVTVDMTTMKVVSADYPTMESHNCDNYATGGGPGMSEISPSIVSPLKQFESGIPLQKIQCKTDLVLVIKAHEGTPACVKQDSIPKLVIRGWLETKPHPQLSYAISMKPYQGIEKESGIVSIKNQSYYMMTLSNVSSSDISPGTTVQFHQVIFSFPYGSLTTPGGVIVPLAMTFPDGTTETLGDKVQNADGSGEASGLGLGPGPSSNRTATFLSDHVNPQAGVTMTEDQIKLLVSTDVNTSYTSNIINETGTVNIGNQTFYFTTLNDTLSSYHGVGAIPFTFNDVNFSLFPSVFSAGPPGSCGDTNFGSEVKFTDGTYERLSVHIPGQPCSENYTETVISNHQNPQAGVQVYHGKIRLLVNTQQTIPNPISSSSSSGPEYKVGPDLLGPIPHQLVFFMKSNSTAKIFVEYTSDEPNTGTVPSYSTVYLGNDGNFTPLTTSDVTITANPSSIPMNQGSDTTVVYTVTAKEGVKGVYWIFLVQFCRVMPLAIDINSLTISPSDIPVQMGMMSCPAQFLNGKILGISGGTAEYKIGQPVG